MLGHALLTGCGGTLRSGAVLSKIVSRSMVCAKGRAERRQQPAELSAL